MFYFILNHMAECQVPKLISGLCFVIKVTALVPIQQRNQEDSARPKYVHYAVGIFIVGTSLKQARTYVELIERQEDEAEVPRKRQERPLFHLLPPRRNFCPGILIDPWSLLVQY